MSTSSFVYSAKRSVPTGGQATSQQANKRPRSTSSENERQKTLFQKCVSVFKTIHVDNPELTESQHDQLVELLENDRGVWIKSSMTDKKHTTGTESEANAYLVARSEAAIYLARHYSSKCTSDSSDLNREKALKYHQIACEKLGRGKYDVRGDAFYNYGKFLKKVSGDLMQAAKCYKIAAKSASFWSCETSEKSAYSKAESAYRHLSDRYTAINDDVEAVKCLVKAEKCAQNALENKRKNEKLESVDEPSAEKNLFYAQMKKHIKSLKKHGFSNQKLGKKQIAKIRQMLDSQRDTWLHPDASKSKQCLQTRSELAYLLAEHYASIRGAEANALAIRYYEIAIEKLSTAKYDVNKMACISYANYLKRKDGILELKKVAKLYETAAKATDFSLTEIEYSVSLYKQASDVYIKLVQSTTDINLQNYYLIRASKCVQNSLDKKSESEPQIQITPDLEVVSRSEAATSTQASISTERLLVRKPLGIILQNTSHQTSSAARSSADFGNDEVPPHLEFDDRFETMPELGLEEPQLRSQTEENLVNSHVKKQVPRKKRVEGPRKHNEEYFRKCQISDEVVKFKASLRQKINACPKITIKECSMHVFDDPKKLYRFLSIKALPQQRILNEIANFIGISVDAVQFKHAIKDA